VLVFFAALQIFPKVKERIVSAKNEASSFLAGNNTEYTSVASRFMIWESGYEVIKQNPVFGAGTGDAKDKLLEEAQKKNYILLVEKNVNYHNQYFQTMAAIGLPGLFLLLGSIVIGVAYGIQKRDYLCLSFFTIIAISFLTESVLERQTGVIFYSLFSALLIFADREKSLPTS
jgi:O-antigen ligase